MVLDEFQALIEVAHLSYLANEAKTGYCFWCGQPATGQSTGISSNLILKFLFRKGKPQIVETCDRHVNWDIACEAEHRARDS